MKKEVISFDINFFGGHKKTISFLLPSLHAFWVMTVLVFSSSAHAQESQPELKVLKESKSPAGTLVFYQWDKSVGFLPVPEMHQRRGDAACIAQGPELEAVGYHPNARFNGSDVPGGGFLCRQKAKGSEPQEPPPRMITVNGIAGWDNPRAFGRVPGSHVVQANLACAKKDPRTIAVAFHPGALDFQGKPIPGGSAFCAPLQNTPIAAR